MTWHMTHDILVHVGCPVKRSQSHCLIDEEEEMRRRERGEKKEGREGLTVMFSRSGLFSAFGSCVFRPVIRHSSFRSQVTNYWVCMQPDACLPACLFTTSRLGLDFTPSLGSVWDRCGLDLSIRLSNVSTAHSCPYFRVQWVKPLPNCLLPSRWRIFTEDVVVSDSAGSKIRVRHAGAYFQLRRSYVFLVI